MDNQVLEGLGLYAGKMTRFTKTTNRDETIWKPKIQTTNETVLPSHLDRNLSTGPFKATDRAGIPSHRRAVNVAVDEFELEDDKLSLILEPDPAGLCSNGLFNSSVQFLPPGRGTNTDNSGVLLFCLFTIGRARVCPL